MSAQKNRTGYETASVQSVRTKKPHELRNGIRAKCPHKKTARATKRHSCRVSTTKKPHGLRTGIRAEPHNHTPHQSPTRSILATFMVRPICHTPKPESLSDRSPEPHSHTPHQSPTRSILATFMVRPICHTPKHKSPSDRSLEPHSRILPRAGGVRVPQAGGFSVFSTPTRSSLETPLGGIRGNRRRGDSWKQDAVRSILDPFAVYPTWHTPKHKSPLNRPPEPHSRILPQAGGFASPRRGGLAAISTPTRGSLETPLGGIRGNRTYPHSWKQDVPPIRGNRVHPHSWK